MNRDNKIIKNNPLKRNWPRNIWDNLLFSPFEEESWEITPFRSELQEDQNNYYVKAELPGVPKEKIDIELVNNQLRIHAEKEEEKETTNKKYHFSEISYGSFTRTYNLPRTVNSQSIKADYKEGVLTVTIPKSEENKGRKIRIE
ncbi:Hsp20/alpha crystallin family protein [endosymbiont GvMRE of Glomus versiforme]|uniref:Hsp20/alpha crystallin family protein n=1 Tax=endosymbiont GvMRE of Glomus versiforme TaxID=2039283 RepID=UPI000EE46402|nr:Hsp20/alpha crystallin family protein [endosymbiont GvMRE of Glomus versiforme]RHZ35331.1 Heat shock protein Hsp20 [endosymbiont GvMRE of Glomus versiforme]